ncbi:PTS sugar transporter subunit IIA [Enterococcus mundtii]|uniref:PTS sugar transporter subunit IIA n=1 Tax=Enterococcus mundtii TaxID=53346 RepID=UPI0018996124|nr:PTS sugar transporter subunit IIA [Enterococcus mundtii]MDB7088265.1 PTS sugar transporter subunit IIA [Enterococcus mundtii]
MDYTSMFDERLIFLDLEGDNLEDLFGEVAKRLQKEAFVNKNYLKGLIAREQVFPTGLITQYLNIGLPHSEPAYVEKPFIAIVRLSTEVKIKQMGDSQEMLVRNLFFLGIKEPKEQVGLLQSLMALFMDEKFVKAFIEAREAQVIYQLVTQNIK